MITDTNIVGCIYRHRHKCRSSA